MADQLNFSCPIPLSGYDKITLAHGGGGSFSYKLLHELIFKYLNSEPLAVEHDGAILDINGVKLAFSTDSFVIDPIFFPGGNIGELAVYGTVNDIACCGAKPMFISLSLIIEEGLPIDQLETILASIKYASDKASVSVVTGDTKVVGNGKGDKIFINTSGIGLVYPNANISPGRATPGDAILLSGTIADHGVAIMASRSGLKFNTSLVSDTAPLNDLIEDLLKELPEIHVLRDPTRGGLASALNEIARSSHTGIFIEEKMIPIKEEVKGLCEILGLDPLYIANEGKLLVILPAEFSSKALEILHQHPVGSNAALIGYVNAEHLEVVRMKTSIGTHRIVDMISGEQLPRIC